MCGIAGFYGKGDSACLRKMTDSLRHRGPDEGGVFMDGLLGLGHRRLSILDLAHGAQPMRDRDTGMVIVYNGELYNHPEIRAGLERHGRKFTTSHCDTETVLRAFIEWGPDCFSRFNGMFACAIYDPASRALWLACDRFSEKPLFYCRNAGGFAFASEMVALRHWPGFRADLDGDNIQRFFAWNYLPGGRTLYKSCHALQPGSWLRLDLDSGEIKSNSYWSFELEPDESLSEKDEPALVDELRALLIQATRRRLLSDVPLGIFLSGGIDSSSVLAAATRSVAADQIQTFTIGFTEPSFDESANAREVAEYFGVSHHLRMLTALGLERKAEAIFRHMSEPLGDASIVPTCELAAFAREHVTVALSGDGGDELFAGYDPLAALAPAALWRRFMPGASARLARRLLSFWPSSDRNMSLEFKLKRVFRGLAWPLPAQLPIWMSALDPEQIREFFTRPLSWEELYEDAIKLRQGHPHLDELGQALLFFTRFYLSNDILVKTDRAAMRSSLESRAVFLDNDIVDFARRLPNHFKYRKGARKYILRKALEGWLPKRIIDLPKKGFGIPLNLWLRAMPSPSSAPGLKAGVVEACQKAHLARRGDFRFFLWDLHVLAGILPEKGAPC